MEASMVVPRLELLQVADAVAREKGIERDEVLEVLEPYGVMEMARTGTLAMARGEGAGDRRAARPADASNETQDIAYSV